MSLVAGFVAAASARSRARFASASSSSATTNSDEFQKLMGVCYGAAGVAHLFDLLGPNLLPAMAGAPSFQELPLPGQLAALFWCALRCAVGQGFISYMYVVVSFIWVLVFLYEGASLAGFRVSP